MSGASDELDAEDNFTTFFKSAIDKHKGISSFSLSTYNFQVKDYSQFHNSLDCRQG